MADPFYPICIQLIRFLEWFEDRQCAFEIIGLSGGIELGQAPERDDGIQLGLDIVGIALGQDFLGLQRGFERFAGRRLVSLLSMEVAEAFVADCQIALPFRIAGIGVGQFVGNGQGGLIGFQGSG